MDYSYSWKGLLNPGKAVDFFQGRVPRSFQADKAQFSHINAWWLSELCRLIYVRGDQEKNSEGQTAARNSFLHKVGLEEQWFYNGRHIQCSIIGPRPGHRKPYGILVFRGTQKGISSWIYNLNFMLSTWPSGGCVHRGFKLLMLEAWEEIRPQLDSMPYPMYYTGHSLGGSLAILAATLKVPEAVYTFGAPKMADASFIKSVSHINIYRIVNPEDIVANIPPIPAIQQVGEAHYLAGGRASNSYRSWRDAPSFLADHAPSNYRPSFNSDGII